MATSEQKAIQAREEHTLAQEAGVQAAQHRDRRDALVRQLRADNPDYWTYGRLAKAVGCSVELIALIVKSVPREDRIS